MIDVNELVKNLSLSELNEAADKYWKRFANNPRLMTKPYNLGDAEHIFPQLGFLIQGLQLYAGMTVLDFGAGSCYASRILNQMGLRVLSMDVSTTALEIGRGLRRDFPPIGEAPEHLFTVFDGRRFDLPDASVDRIFCLDAFHHVPDQYAVLQEMGRVLKDGGIAGFSEPGPNHSKSSEAQFEMRNSNVIENDVVLSKVLQDSYQHGFTDLKVSISTIHPPLIPLEKAADYLLHQTDFVNAVHERVKNYPIFFLYKGDPTIRDSRNPAGLCCKIVLPSDEIFATGDQPVKFVIEVLNNSPKIWLASANRTGCVNVGCMLKKEVGFSVSDNKEYRFSLSPIDLESGSVVSGVEINLGLLEKGEYRLDLDLVCENLCWFQSQCDSMVSVKVTVQ